MPDPVYHWNIEQGTDQWHDLRRGLITGSGIAKLITGTGKFAKNETSRGYLYQLLAERITNTTEQSFYNDDMARGHMLEPFARELYAEHYDPVQECGFVTCSMHGITLGYSPDGLVGDDGIIEIKSPRAKTHLRNMLTNEVPAEYMPQIQCGMAVTGRGWCDFISYVPGLPLYVRRVAKDEITIAQLILAAQAAEEQLAGSLVVYQQFAGEYPATEQIQQPEEIIV